MRELTMNDLMREDGTFDYKRYQELTNNYWEHGRFQSCVSLLEKSQQQVKSPQQVNRVWKDNVTISKESLEMMEKMKENRVSLEDLEYLNPLGNDLNLNMTGTVTYIAKLSEAGEELLKQGKSKGASLMGSAYGILRDEIAARYSDPDYKPAIVVEEGGERAHFMTMEEEIGILDKAYESIAEFHAVSAREMAKYKGNYQTAGEIYQRTKQEYLAAKETRYMEKLKQKVENLTAKETRHMEKTKQNKTFLRGTV